MRTQFICSFANIHIANIIEIIIHTNTHTHANTYNGN